jgi:hypothetical protein
MEWLKERIAEPSTWRGLSLLLGLAGVNVAPELVWQIGQLVAAIWAGIEVARKEK